MKSIWKLLLVGVVAVLVCGGCASPDGEPADAAPADEVKPATSLPTDPVNTPCGDGVCDSVESKSGQCPQDCMSTPEIQSQQIGESQAGFRPGAEAKLYLGLMVHLEGWSDEMDQEDKFIKHMDAALELAEIFEEYGARVTFEASPETIAASAAWDNLLLELQESGHGIGVHADKGYSQNPNFNQGLFTTQIREMREDAEGLGLVIEHVSGICSSLDWGKAAIDAGYSFTTGGVGYCAMSMPEELRPEIYQDCPSPAQCHGNMPLEMADRIHPWRINTASADWTIPDPAGALVILSSDSGIKNLFEESLDSQATHGDMEYTSEDIDVLVGKVEEALTLVEPGKVNQIYFSLSIGAADIDRTFYESMFRALQPFVDSGDLEYKTLNEVYHLYLAAE